ncbi:hypothetical protein F4818DRAFT_76104 [Hypoxylon cercidicola]|nr:hypothetical protein F4818DRAFT_76104 [Hypoxylon cercidicola]
MDHNSLSSMGESWQRNTSLSDYSHGFSQAAFNSNSTFGVINQFKFLAAKSIRTSTIILAAFNIVSAFATAAGIYYDCYSSAKRSNSGSKARINLLRCVQGPETYPFVLSLGITVQGIIFAVSQSFGLEGLFIPGCSLISQFMWPAIFIVPYIQLVFGLEVTSRALRRRPFPSRGKWTTVICLVIVKVLLVATGLVGFFIRPPSLCFASLFWYVAKWAEGGFILLLVVVVILAVCSVIIFIKLTRYSTIETSERVSASRTVYYLALAVVTNALLVPFFVTLTFPHMMDDNGEPGLTLSMVSTVVANVTGLMTGGLHLFLRSNTIGTIAPKDKLAEYERQQAKHPDRTKGIDSMDFNGHMLEPVSGPGSFPKSESQVNLVNEKDDVELGNSPPFSPRDTDPLRSNAVFNAPDIPQAPEPATVAFSISPNTHSRKPSASYTLFPGKNQSNTASVALLPSTAYNPYPQSNVTAPNFPFNNDYNDSLRPPPSIQVWGRHKRDSSMASSATVQIGLRLSNIADIGPMRKPSSETERVYTLDCPEREDIGIAYRPSPLATASALNVPSPRAHVRPRDSLAKYVRQEPTEPAEPAEPEEEKKDCTLSPTVYNPKSPTKTKTPSPRGVGFNVPRRANTTPVEGASTPSPSPSSSPHRGRGNSSSAAENTSDWI